MVGGRQNQSTLQYGQQVGNVGAYIGGNLFNDGGYRKFSPSHVRQLFADIGAESEHGSLHLSFTGANNTLAGIGPTPIQLADIDLSAVFTSPQSFQNTLLMPVLNANYNVSDALSFQANFYYRGAERAAVRGSDLALLRRHVDTADRHDRHASAVERSQRGDAGRGRPELDQLAGLRRRLAGHLDPATLRA